MYRSPAKKLSELAGLTIACESIPIERQMKDMKQITNLVKSTTMAVSAIVVTLGISGCASNGASGLWSKDAASYDASTNRVQRHVYAGLGLGRSRMEPDTSEVPGANVNDRIEPGGQVTLGMDLSRQLAVELHSADLGSAGVTPASRINYHIHGASALLYAGKNRHNFKRHGFSGFGRLGVGYLDNSVDGPVNFVRDNSTHVLVGAGLEYMTRIGLGVRAEAIAYEEDAQYGQLGVVYRTGKRPSRRPVQIVKAPEPKPIPEPTPTPIPVPAVVVAEPAPVDTCSEFSGTLDGVNFHSDSEQLTSDAQAVLDGVASRLSECDSVPVRISAHTDSVGADSYNQSLSERRANSVSSYLQSRGIDGSRLNSEAYGETQPIDTNDTPEGRRRNRRVELLTVQ